MIASVCAGGLVLLAVIGGYRLAQWRAVPEYSLYRGAAIRQQARVIPAGGVLFVGDSIVDQSFTPLICGLPVLNAGMSGATVADLFPVARDAIALAKPALILISVGINNALPKSRHVSVEAYGEQLDGMVAAAMASGARVVLLTQTAVRHDQMLSIDLPKLNAIDGTIRNIAEQRGTQLVDITAALAGPDGQMQSGRTMDGVHLTAAGYAAWHEAIKHVACRSPAT